MQEGVEDVAVERGGLEAAVGATLGQDGGQRLRAEMRARGIFVGALGNETVDQHAGWVEVIDGRAVFVHHPERAVGGAGDAFEVATEWVVGERPAAQVHRLFVGVGRAVLARHVGQAGDGRAVGAREGDAIGDGHRPRRGVYLEGDDLGPEVGQGKGALVVAVAVHVERLGVGAAVGVGEEAQRAGDLVAPFEPEAGETAQGDLLPGKGRARGREVGEGDVLHAEREGQAGILVAERDERDRPARDQIHDGQRVVLLERNPGRGGVGRNGDVLRLEILGDGRVGTVDADGRVQVHAVEGGEARGGHGALRQVLDAIGEIDDADGAFRVLVVSLVRLALVGDDHLAAVGSEGEHVGQRADLDGGQRIAVGVEEDGLAVGGLFVGLDCGSEHTIVNVYAVGRDTPGRDVDGAHERGGGRVAQVEHVYAACCHVDDERALRAGVEGDDLGRRAVEDARDIAAQGGQGKGWGRRLGAGGQHGQGRGCSHPRGAGGSGEYF